jgi:hypothetical protein
MFWQNGSFRVMRPARKGRDLYLLTNGLRSRRFKISQSSLRFLVRAGSFLRFSSILFRCSFDADSLDSLLIRLVDRPQ